MRRAARFDHLYLALAGACSAVALGVVVSTASPRPLQWIAAAAVVLSCAMAVAETLARSVKAYFAALALHTTFVAVAVSLSGGGLLSTLCLLCVLTAGACVHNPFPLNIAVSAGAGFLVLAPAGLILAELGTGPSDLVAFVLAGCLFVALVTLFGSLMVRYREWLIDCQEETQRLDALVDRLTRANLRYQEYAKSVAESSTENERKRITRDIHDIVGYTLTNNITIMEAITDIMRINPLGVAHLVEMARQNAQEGLARAREALHLLRRQEIGFPRGREAVEKLLKVFEHATGVQTEIAYTEVPWRFSDEVDSALYHTVQESLMNSFRHGKASSIRLFISRDGKRVMMRIRDNGKGADAIVEGIGVSGMRERLEKLGGELAVGNAPGGFDVIAWVPAEDQ